MGPLHLAHTQETRVGPRHHASHHARLQTHVGQLAWDGGGTGERGAVGGGALGRGPAPGGQRQAVGRGGVGSEGLGGEGLRLWVQAGHGGRHLLSQDLLLVFRFCTHKPHTRWSHVRVIRKPTQGGHM